MALNSIDAKIRIKRTASTGSIPTMGPSDDHTDGSWSDDDIYVGELFMNSGDDRLWMGTDTGPKEITLITGSQSAVSPFYIPSGSNHIDTNIGDTNLSTTGSWNSILASSGSSITDAGGTELSNLSTIHGGGDNSIVKVSSATISGGSGNEIQAGGTGKLFRFSTISGGGTNKIGEEANTIGGGLQNKINYNLGFGTTTGAYSTVGGGYKNQINTNGDENTIGGGYYNNIYGGKGATISGGKSNYSGYNYTVICGGKSNGASSIYSSILGGQSNSTNYKNNVHIIGSNLTATRADTTYTEDLIVSGVAQVKVYTVATLPTASTYPGGIIMVSDETGGYVQAFSDGTNWRRVTDRAVVA